RGWTNRLPTWKRLQDPEAELVKPPPPKVPDISVVICTYNRAELLGGALKTLDNQYYPNTHYEIVVVDDGSTDDTVEVIKSLDLRTDLCYVHQENRGRAAARNVGVAHAKSDLILFVDDDILAPPTLIEEHIRWHTRYRKGIVRGPIKIIQEYALPDRNNVGFLDYSTAMFCTCNASSSKYSIIQAGGFDESFREYGFEDNEMGWRLRLEGYKAHFNNRAVVFHYKPPLRPDQIGEVEQRAEEMARSAMAYYYKHPHWKVALATGLNPLVASWSRIWYSESMYRSCMRQWESGNGSPQGRAKLEHKLFKYFYYRALEKEAHKSGKS
ncbi:MAG TPA: glycosyltransferase family A protein, partial [Candidatus Xenobia bacterium]